MAEPFGQRISVTISSLEIGDNVYIYIYIYINTLEVAPSANLMQEGAQTAAFLYS